MSNQHSESSPSQLPRIRLCPGSVQACRNVEEVQSQYAAEGEMLHLATERSLDILPSSMETQVPKDILDQPILDSEQRAAVQDSFEFVVRLRESMALLGDYTECLEGKVSLEHFGLPEVYGTCDYILWNDATIHIADWKYGRGVPVYVENNDQIYAYALGAIGTPERLEQFDQIWIYIRQPRISNSSKMRVTRKELLDWLEEIKRALSKAEGKHAPLVAGTKQCQFCKARFTCKTRYNKAMEVAQEVFAVHAKLPDQVSAEEVANVLTKAPILEKYLKDLAVYALNECLLGRDIPGKKAVYGRAIRRWIEEAKAIEYLLGQDVEVDDLYVSKMVGPAAAEKLLKPAQRKEEDFKALIVKPQGKPTLADTHDKREAITSQSAECAFQQYKE